MSVLVTGMMDLHAQAPAISYGAYKIFTKDSAIVPLAPVNRGGEVPNTIYSNTQTFAGNDNAGFMDGTGRKAKFNRPSKIAVDNNGYLYVSDELNNRIRKIAPDGTVTTLAGSGKPGAENNVMGLKASFNNPSGIAVDKSGNVYVADVFNHRIRKISPSGAVSTYAGNGQAAFADNTNGLNASFHFPVDLAVDEAGNIYVVDEGNNRIRKITPGGSVSTFAGSGYTGSFDSRTGEIATFNQPNGITIDKKGNLYVADQLNHKIRKITSAGVVTTFAGSGAAGSLDNVMGAMASFNNPRGIVVDKAGNVFVGDVANQKIRKISSTGAVSTLSGSGAPGSQDNANGLLAGFYFPNGLAVDDLGDLFVADALNNKIRIVELKGYSISPELLPAGLQFDRVKGIFTGTPIENTINSVYHITAYNVNGSSSTNLGIAVSSQPGNALSFDGFDDKVVIQDAASLRPPVVSVELWVNIHTLTSRFGRMILKRNEMPAYDDSYSVGIDSLFRFTATMCSGTGTVEGQKFAYQKEPLESGRWYFVSAVFSKDSVRLYVNGVHQQSTYTGFPIGHGKSALSFGFDERLAFSMDEVRIFNTDRSAFFQEDMYNTLSPATEGLAAYYNFNSGRPSGDNTGATNVIDLTANGNNGVLIGFQLLPGDISNWTESYAMVVPVAKEATSISDQGFVANWEKPHFGEVFQYRLDVSTDPLFHSFVPGYYQLPVTTGSQLLKGLASNTVYYYRIAAEGALFNGRGKYSNVITVKTNH
jgi:sugar lactone lactonase YvrE